MQVEEHMEFRRGFDPEQSPLTGEPAYDPPRVEAVVTAGELERESLYAGTGSYGPI